ncbi:unnamed protein product [Peronospora destructor]|uniref:Uncharacterized protein n=1 Tax=Peronospora destructor TaxID=86335 RepID=A0AAV0VBQ6_9STRA|nr:unnamed protein product [Peronospora destructor]
MMIATSVTINTGQRRWNQARPPSAQAQFYSEGERCEQDGAGKLIIAGVVGITSFITLNVGAGRSCQSTSSMFGILFLLFEVVLPFIFFIGFLDFGIGSALATLAGVLMCFNAFINLLVMCRHPQFKSTLSANADPTAGYTTSSQEAASFMSKNPELAAKAGQYAFQQAANTRH